MRRSAIALGLALAALVPLAGSQAQDVPAASTAQAEFQPDRVRLLAIFRTLDYGEQAYLSGQFRHLDHPDAETEYHADKAIILEEAPYPHDVFTEVARTTSDQEGYFFFTRRPEANVRYRVRTEDPVAMSSAPIVRVRLRPSLSVSRRRVAEGRSITFSGAVRPAHDRLTVLIQRKDDGGRWRYASRTRLRLRGGRSTFEKRLRARRSGEYRVRVAGDADNLPGTSRAVPVTVVPRRGG